MNIVLIRGQLVKNTSGMKMLLLASKQTCLFDNQVRKNLTLFSFENWKQIQTDKQSGSLFPFLDQFWADSETITCERRTSWRTIPGAPCPVDSPRIVGAVGRAAPESFVQSWFSFWLYKFHYPASTPLRRELVERTKTNRCQEENEHGKS